MPSPAKSRSGITLPAGPAMVPDLTVVIVSWNVRALLRQCLRSLIDAVDWAGGQEPVGADSSAEGGPGTKARPVGAAGEGRPHGEVIVVDNASGDGSAEMVRAEFPQVRLIRNETNRGFTAANNQGLAVARGRYLLLLNPDTEVMSDALATMAGYMNTHPMVGALGPQLRYPDGRRQSSRRRFPTLATALVESTIVQEWWKDNRHLRRYYMNDTPDDAVQPVDWLVGACLLVRREAFEQVGGLDEGYFMYSEEMDWCRRIKDARWEIVYLPAATVIHHEGKSSEQVVAARHIHFQSSKVRYFQKFHGAGRAAMLRWFLLSTYVFQMAREAVKWLVGHKRPLRAERIRAYCQVLRSGLRAEGL